MAGKIIQLPIIKLTMNNLDHAKCEISVIVPVFNVEKELEKCIESILLQKGNFEIILIDDGSTDRSGQICDTYADLHSMIRVFHKRNEGVSVARNIGIELAEGHWLTFVDSDDEIKENFFEDFENAIKVEPCLDLYMADVYQKGVDGRCFVEYHLPKGLFNIREAIAEHRILRSGDLHGKVFCTNIVFDNDLRFESEIHYSEDRLFLDTYLRYIDHVYLDNSISYIYTRNVSGLSFKLNTFESEYNCFKKLHSALLSIANKNDLKVEDLLHNNPAQRTLWAARKLSRTDFNRFATEISAEHRLYFLRVLHKMKIAKVLSFLFNHKQYDSLYYFLKLESKLKELKK